jgi:tetratricopeptide (TPR) repeat protein
MRTLNRKVSARVMPWVLFASLVLAGSPMLLQGWRTQYEQALALAKRGQWAQAREHFLSAIKEKPEDESGPVYVGGSVTDRRPWRAGAPYSPNFGAAYCAFKLAAEARTPEERNTWLNQAIQEFEKLINSGKVSAEALLFLAAAYSANNNLSAAEKIQQRLVSLDRRKALRVDQEIIEFKDLRVIRQAEIPTAGSLPLPDVTSPLGIVPVLDYKFALLVGNAQGSQQTFAHNDVDLLKEALTKYAGYAESNIVTLKDTTTQSLKSAAEALARNLPDNAVVFIFFSGRVTHEPETNTDYLMGTDVTEEKAYDKMLKKLDLFQPFVQRGATVFCFFQVDRTMVARGKYFGLEIPRVGRIAQCFGCMPGETVFGTVWGDKPQGVYALAIAEVLKEWKNNRIPIHEFAWAVFDKVRGSLGRNAGGAQTPTLPVLVGMGATAAF